jgi:hemoglobin
LGGFGALTAVHRHLEISEEQWRRFVELYTAALDEVGLPDDEPFREAVRSHVEFGSRVAMQNSHAESDDELGSGYWRRPAAVVGAARSAVRCEPS